MLEEGEYISVIGEEATLLRVTSAIAICPWIGSDLASKYIFKARHISAVSIIAFPAI
jgi:hypothetical protein